jgi:hypothetical protein
MTVRELIALLSTMPQDAPVIRTFCSDFDEVDADQISVLVPDETGGIIRHHGHLMRCQRNWLDTGEARVGKYMDRLENVPPESAFLTCVHFAGN